MSPSSATLTPAWTRCGSNLFENAPGEMLRWSMNLNRHLRITGTMQKSSYFHATLLSQAMKVYLLVVYVPVSHEIAVREAMEANKGGAIGNYDSCSFTSRGTGRFRPLAGANPYIGVNGSVAVVDEVKIECVVLEENLATVVSAVKASHPYEEPAIFLSEIIDYKTLLPAPPISSPPSSTAPVEKVAAHMPISVVLEGLDGVGKSTVALRLAEILNAKHMVTPPAIMLPARQWFVQQDNHMRRAYYMVGNFIAGTEMKSEVDAGRSVVLDRFYASTMAYILGKKDLDQPLPARGDEAYTWPAELYRPTCMFVLVLPEADRIARRQSRTSVAETDEEKLLRETPAIPQRINAVYEHIGCTRIDIVASDSVEQVVRKVVQAINRETGLSL